MQYRVRVCLTRLAISGSISNMEIMYSLDSINILGMRIDRVAMDQVLAMVDDYIRDRKPRHFVTADASMVVTAQEDPELHDIIERADLVTPDGAGILWASRQLGVPIKHKVSGVDLVSEVTRLSAAKGYRVYFIGAAPGVADEARTNLTEKYPGAQIVGCQDGYFTGEKEPEILENIKKANPDVLFVAMGIPKQEKWINRHKEYLGVPISVGIGGSFDVYSGRVKRAPVWMQKNGLEWLYRLWSNPRKIGKVMTLPKFAVMTLKRKISGS